MSRQKEKIDPNQMEFNWDFPSKWEKVLQEKEEIQDQIIAGPPKINQTENEFQVCVVLAAGIKKAITESGLSRDQIVDLINEYFGRSREEAQKDDPSCNNPLTINMFNNYLSKPAKCPIPAYYLFAIHHVTESLEPARVFVEAEGARIASGAEIRQMNMGKIEDHLTEIKKLKKEIKCQK